MSAKPRSDSQLKNLPEERQDAIAEWCRAPKTDECSGGLQYAREMLAADGLKVSLRAVSEFYSWYRLKETLSRANNKAANYEELLKKEFPDATPEKIAEMGQLVFTMEASNSGDVKTFIELESLRLAKATARTKAKQKEADLKLAERRVKLLEEKASEAKAKLTQIAAKGGLSEETLREIEEAAKLL